MNAAAALRRALVAAFASDRIIADIAAVRSTPWASVTFTGVRHELSMRLSGPRADELITGLSERELDLPGHILIDIAATEVGRGGDNRSVKVEALTVAAD